jgi:glycerate-2-kinase
VISRAAATLARELFSATLARLDPADRVAAALRDLDLRGDAVVVAVGKAAARMAAGAGTALGPRLAGGLAVMPEAASVPVPDRVRRMFGSHPIASAASESAGRALLSTVEWGDPDQTVVALISGGASALAAVPARGLSLGEKQVAIAAVMASGAPIQDINAIRKHLSAFKGGWLAAAAAGPVITLVASDVVGDPLTAVGSGPTVPDPTTFADACAIIERTCTWSSIPEAVRHHLELGRSGQLPETPKRPRRGDRALLIAGTAALIDEAVAAASAAGADVRVAARNIVADVSEVARDLAVWARQAAATAAGSRRPVCRVAGGEPTVLLPPDVGKGGRAQQLALATAEHMADLSDVAVMVVGSDGIDGNTPAAGAVVTGATWKAAIAAGHDPGAALRRRDAHGALAATDSLVITGATGVNHADLVLIVALPPVG